MHTEDFFINNCGDRHCVKNITEYFPKLQVISSFAFIIETVKSINAC